MADKRYFDGFNEYNDIFQFLVDRWNDGATEKARQNPPEGFPTDPQVLFASYGTQEAYSGDAIVIYSDNGRLYEANGSHCSCYGLEGQWHPEETSWAAIAMRNYIASDHCQEARQALYDLCVANGQTPAFKRDAEE